MKRAGCQWTIEKIMYKLLNDALSRASSSRIGTPPISKMTRPVGTL